MNENTTNTPAGATLTQKELFQRFLDSPVYPRAHKSTLVDNKAVSDETMKDHLFGFSACSCVGIPEDVIDRIIDDLRADDDPAGSLEELIDQLRGLLVDMQRLEVEFSAVAALTRTDEPDDDVPDEVFREWEDNPRYVLPVVEAEKDAA